ncbi:MAG: GNAT family N-acetyltransferase [Candidatus Marinimicrobia bacterium]|nr:GNAT family N-acetyltransferase [Candidatus Neomarinimicrobiota bacterium]
MVTEMQTAKILLRDRIRNINIINFIKNYPPCDIILEGNSILVRGISDRPWVYISSITKTGFSSIIRHLAPDDTCFAILEDWMLPLLTKNKETVWSLSCDKLYLPDSTQVSPISANIRDLSVDDTDYIYTHYMYKTLTSPEYISERIQHGAALGIDVNNTLAAWMITHDDGAMGFLEVLPEYRRRGFGRALTAAMISRLRQQKTLPFVHIESDNIPSLQLAKQFGFIFDRRIHWIELAG